MPVAQRLVAGVEVEVNPWAEPQEPLITGPPPSLALQLAVVPPFTPLHLHIQAHSPVLSTGVVAVPVVQRLAVGVGIMVWP